MMFPIFFTGCIDETIDTSIVTGQQAIEPLLWAMPAFLNKYDVLGRYPDNIHYDWGYGSQMHIRDVMGEDMAIRSSGYDWYSGWETNTAIGEGYARTQLIWNYYYRYILTANNLLSAIDPSDATELQLGYLGAGYAVRAHAYLDIARMCEFLENDRTSAVNAAGNNVLNLTVPIVTEATTEEEAGNNPRATREQMYNFILSDLNHAEEYIVHFARPMKVFPDLAVVYGLKARLYLWVGDYANAQLYARKAIDEDHSVPMTQAQCLSKTNGFNDLSVSSWMWGAQMVAEDDVVQSGILNWTSWMSNETNYGYASAGPYLMINAKTYDQISDDDFRKLLWKAPTGSPLAGQTPFIDNTLGASLPTYASIKFRPNEGNMDDYKTASSSAYPLMRVEEMYFIEAEAAVHQNPAQGKDLLENFMKTYRYASYSCSASDVDGVVAEIIFQKQVELWGEGLNFFDYKRLNMPVTRGYTGTNFANAVRFNTTTRPAWMNFCIVQTEKNNNLAVMGYENPDPSDKYTPWMP